MTVGAAVGVGFLVVRVGLGLWVVLVGAGVFSGAGFNDAVFVVAAFRGPLRDRVVRRLRE